MFHCYVRFQESYSNQIFSKGGWNLTLYQWQTLIPIASVYDIFTYIYQTKSTIHAGKYTNPMDGMGMKKLPQLPSISRFGHLSNSDQVVRASAPQRPIKIRPLGRPKPPSSGHLQCWWFSEGNPPKKFPEQFRLRNSTTNLPRIISWSRYPTKREVRKLIFKSAGLGVDMLTSQEIIFIHNRYFTDPTAASTSWWYFLCIYTL